MTTQIRHIILFAIIALFSFAVWRYFVYQEETATDKPFTKGYSIADMELRITDATGAMSAKFISPDLIRYTDSPIIHIATPQFWTYNNGKEQWLITATNAEFNTILDEVHLQNNLLAKTIDADPLISFTAKNLIVNLATKFAHTDDEVFFKQQQLSMRGQSAKIDLNNKILEVNKNVKAIYKTVQ
ncbi:MAG: LPS export ABC transporter periplasmic protein LptC [Proteobacteria bacterium]|nr:LPS export ABC transporter periplasmic protein LptC [Pseudomonadota bacterium]